MTVLTPKQMQNLTQDMKDKMDALRKKAVFVGLPRENIGGAIYGDGTTVLLVGATHEYGTKTIPQRSFLRMPFEVREKQVRADMAKQFEAMLTKGRAINIGLGFIGTIAVNLIGEAFQTGGFGNWEANSPVTVERKGSSKPLVDTATLRNSITYAVRDVA